MTKRLIEVRSYKLKPGAAAAFLIRAYADLADLKARQDAFYGSDAWKKGPRESTICAAAIVALTPNYFVAASSFSVKT